MSKEIFLECFKQALDNYIKKAKSPADALKNGIVSSRPKEQSNKIDDYTNHTNSYIGVSTSKDISIARQYQTTSVGGAYGVYSETGYLYKINYRGVGGVDINKTLANRNKPVNPLSFDKGEVNVIGRVPPSDIMGYYDKNDKYHENPDYAKNKAIIQPKSFSERLTSLFSEIFSFPKFNTSSEYRVSLS